MVEKQEAPVATMQQTAGELPPAGFNREEVLKARMDQLEERLDQMPDVGRVNPDAFDVDRELAQAILDTDYMQVRGAQEGRAYRWVSIGGNGRYITQARGKGWNVVQGEDPENLENRDVDSTRRIGDTILMWTTLANDAKWARIDAEIRRRQQSGSSSVMDEIAERVRDRGIIIKTDLDAGTLDRMGKIALAKQLAVQQSDRMLREGSVRGFRPGAEVGLS